MPLHRKRFFGSVLDRFWIYAGDTSDAEACWVWEGTMRGGYGRLYDGTRQAAAHRFAYELLIGTIPEGLVLDHLCRNPPCVNPAHLEPVTSAENIARGIPKYSKVTHCPKGHEYTDENVYRPPGSPNRRHCRACWRGKPGGSQYRQAQRALARSAS